jgi:sugar O-acyltransferase (sialic acid O-acetyltransferase NeuD family)
MEKLLIVGTGGLARELTEWCESSFEIIGYLGIDTKEFAASGLKGRLFPDEVSHNEAGTRNVLIAIGLPLKKERIYHLLTRSGFVFPSFVHASATVAKDITLSGGVVIGPNCVISPNTYFGLSAYINFSVGIGHDAYVGNFAQVNPGVQIGGFANIGDRTLIGSGATVLQGVKVGESATIGSGSVCFGRVANFATVMGNPAKRMRAFEKS